MAIPLEAPRTYEPTDANFRRLVGALHRVHVEAIELLGRSDISLQEFEQLMVSYTEESHIASARLGRFRAGSFDDSIVMDQVLGRVAARSDQYYLHRFVLQLLAGDPRYIDPLGDIKLEAVDARLELYRNRVRGTANQAFVLASPVEATYDWRLVNPENCDVCPDHEANSPYTSESLPAFPADGTTPCRTNCGCILIRDDGVIGFSRVIR